jgi:flavodoxin
LWWLLGKRTHIGGFSLKKILVTYISWTGNTRKVAEAVFGAISGDKELKELGSVSGLSGYDLIFVGFPVHGLGNPPDEAVDFLTKYCPGKAIALFVTHGAPEDSPFIPEWLENCRLSCAGAKVVGIFHCQGQIVQSELDKILQNPDPVWQERAGNLALSKGQPDASRLQRARDFAIEILKRAECQ